MFNRKGWNVNITKLTLQGYKFYLQKKIYTVGIEDYLVGNLNIRTTDTEEAWWWRNPIAESMKLSLNHNMNWEFKANSCCEHFINFMLQRYSKINHVAEKTFKQRSFPLSISVSESVTLVVHQQEFKKLQSHPLSYLRHCVHFINSDILIEIC